MPTHPCPCSSATAFEPHRHTPLMEEHAMLVLLASTFVAPPDAKSGCVTSMPGKRVKERVCFAGPHIHPCRETMHQSWHNALLGSNTHKTLQTKIYATSDAPLTRIDHANKRACAARRLCPPILSLNLPDTPLLICIVRVIWNLQGSRGSSQVNHFLFERRILQGRIPTIPAIRAPKSPLPPQSIFLA